MKALLIDDERLARNELRRLLRAHPEVVVAGEACNLVEAEARLQESQVDLLFLDIEMPGGTGFELLERLDPVPLTVFTTAFDIYAVRAFEVHAIDYLLKPIAPERMTAALDKVKAWVRRMAASATFGEAPARPLLDRVFVRDGGRAWIVPTSDIRLMESEGNYTRLFFDHHHPLILKSLQALENRLNPSIFFRANRSHIINLRWIEGGD